jgi:hypothetical protein
LQPRAEIVSRSIAAQEMRSRTMVLGGCYGHKYPEY